MGPSSPSQQVVESGFLPWESDTTATQVSAGGLCPSRSTRCPDGGPGRPWSYKSSRRWLWGGPLQVGAKAIRTW